MLLTLYLVAAIIVLAAGNLLLSYLPRKSSQPNVKVSFIPPSTIPLSSGAADPKLDAHIASTHQKFTLLFSRVDKLERDLSSLMQKMGISSHETPAETWIATVPVRKKKGN